MQKKTRKMRKTRKREIKGVKKDRPLITLRSQKSFKRSVHTAFALGQRVKETIPRTWKSLAYKHKEVSDSVIEENIAVYHFYRASIGLNPPCRCLIFGSQSKENAKSRIR